MNGKTFSINRDELKAQNPSGHPPVVVSGAIKANDGIYPVGLLLKRDVDNITFIQAAEGDAYAGVLDQTVDTTQQASAIVVIHGSVQAPVLKVGAVVQAAPTQADLLALQKIGIFPA